MGILGQLIREFETLKPDVIHTHQIGTLFYAGPAAQIAGVPLVVHTEHGKEKYATQLKTRVLGRLGGLFLTTFYCLTNDMADAVRSAKIVPERKLRVIFNGVDTSQYMKPCDTLAVRQSLNIPAQARVIGTVGRLTEVKRQDVLIRAFAKVCGRINDVHLLLVGDGPLRQELEDLAKSSGVSDRVHFAGYQPSSSPFLQTMCIFTLTSRSEGMPQAGIEASVCGLPTVASRVGGLPELVEEGRTGLLFPVGDDQALSEALIELLGNEKRAREMGDLARERAIARFDIGRMAAEYHAHFLGHLGSKKEKEGISHASCIAGQF